jgi:hypothetical protein
VSGHFYFSEPKAEPGLLAETKNVASWRHFCQPSFWLAVSFQPSTKRLPMQNKSTNQLIGMGILALVVIFILYEIWPYLVGFLAVVGTAQIYRVWRKHYGS